MHTLFTFEEGKIKISDVSLLYCHYHFVLATKGDFLYRSFQLGPRNK